MKKTLYSLLALVSFFLLSGFSISPSENHCSSLNIFVPDDITPIAHLLANLSDYDGKTIKVQGTATKVNKNIMGKNWVHIDDKSLNGESVDLTITTTDDINVDDQVIFEGKISLDLNLGAGYHFDVIMENAKLIKP